MTLAVMTVQVAVRESMEVAHQKIAQVRRPKGPIGKPRGKSLPLRFSKSEIKLIMAAAQMLDPAVVKER